MGTSIASLTGYGRPTAAPSSNGQVPTYGTDYTFTAWATAGDIRSAGVTGGQTITGGTQSGDDLTLIGSSAGGGDVIVSGSSLVLDNNQYLSSRNTSGFVRPIVGLNASNQVEFRAVDGGGTYVFNTLPGLAVTITQHGLILPNGTAANPSSRFQVGLNAGLFSASEDSIGVSLNKVERYRIGNAGFGVGSINCAENLVAWGTAPGSRDVALTRSSAGVLKVTNGANGGGSGPSVAPFAQFDSRTANYTTALRPAAGNPGRQIYDSTLEKMILDNGTTWVNVDGSDL